MKGVYMPAHVTPRNLRGDARISLDCQFDDLREIADEVQDFDAKWQQFKAKVLRSTSSANLCRLQSVDSLEHAQRIEDAPWDGKRDRRRKDRRRAAPPVELAAAEIAADTFPAVAA